MAYVNSIETLVTEKPANHILTAEPDHAGDRDRREEIDDRIVDGVRQNRVFERVHVAAVDFRKTLVRLASRD